MSDETWEWKLVSRGQLLPTGAEAMESFYYTTQRDVISLIGRGRMFRFYTCLNDMEQVCPDGDDSGWTKLGSVRTGSEVSIDMN
jgi:hypothetical protein